MYKPLLLQIQQKLHIKYCNFLPILALYKYCSCRPDRISGADINAICQEAGMQAVRENRYIVLPKDFEKGYKNNIKKDENDHEFYK